MQRADPHRSGEQIEPNFSKYDPDPPAWRIGGDWLEYDPDASPELRARDFGYRIVGAFLVIGALIAIIGIFFEGDDGDHSTAMLVMMVIGASAAASAIRDLARLLRLCGRDRPGDSAYAWSRLYQRVTGLFNGDRSRSD